MKNIKSTVEIWLDEIKKIVPDTSEYFTLKGGVTVEEIAQLEKELQVQFPENFKNFYGLHDTFGHAVTTAFLFSTQNYEGYDLLPFEQIEEEYASIIDLAEEFSEDGSQNYGELILPKEIKIEGYTNPKWIPFAHDHQGNYLLIDLDPSKDGTFGQIVELENESWERRLVANSLEELIENQIKLLQENKHKGYEFIKEQISNEIEVDDVLSGEEKSVVEDIKFKVFSGLFSDEETLEFSKEIAEDEGVEFSDSEIKKYIQKYRSEQHLLLEESNDVIRLKKALKNLKEQFHIISPPIIGYTQDESIYEVTQEIENLKESGFQSNGYVYFTEQDIERVIDEENLFYLGHGKVISAEGVDVKVADIVVEELKRQGFKVSWNRSDDTRICIENFRWVCEDYFNDELLEKYDFNIDNLKKIIYSKKVPNDSDGLDFTIYGLDLPSEGIDITIKKPYIDNDGDDRGNSIFIDNNSGLQVFICIEKEDDEEYAFLFYRTGKDEKFISLNQNSPQVQNFVNTIWIKIVDEMQKNPGESHDTKCNTDTSLTKENFKTLFGEHLIPEGLQKLFNFGEEYGHYEYSENFYLKISDKTGLKTYSEKDEFINAFIEFAVANGTGSTYAIWIINEDLNQCPIVIFGDEGGMYVVAKNINQLLHLLTLDHEPYVSLDSFDNNISFYIEEDDEDYEHSENHDKYVEWVKDNFGLTLITSAEEAEAIIRNAQDKYQAKLEEFFVRSLKDESTPTKQLDLSKIKTVPFEEVKKYIPEDSWYFNFATSNQEKMWKNVHFIEGDWEIENIDLCSPFIKYDNREKDLELYERQDSSGLFLVTGNLKAKNIYALDDGGAFGLIVLGSVEVENMLVGGSEIHILEDLNVKDLFWGSYNHGGLRVGGNISARVFMVSNEYSFEYDKKKMETEFYLDDQEEEFDDDTERMVEIADELFEPELLQFQLDTIDDDDYEEIYSWGSIISRGRALKNLQNGKSVLKSEFDYGKKEKASKTDKMKFLEEYLTTQDKDFFSVNFCDDNDIDDIAMWIDWREEDDNIITYCEDILQTEELTVETLDAENERGFDTIITYKNQKISIPYKGDGADRDTTIKTLNQIIRSEFEIRLCKESLVFDTLCFIPLTNGQWSELDEKYPKQISDKFEKITTETKFYLDDQKEEFDYGKKEKKEVEEIPEIFPNKSFSNKETFNDQFANFQQLMTYFRNEESRTFNFKLPEINASILLTKEDGSKVKISSGEKIKLKDLILIEFRNKSDDFSQGDEFMIWRQPEVTGFMTFFKKPKYKHPNSDGKPMFVFLYKNESKGINDYRIAFELIKVEALRKIWDLILTTIEKGIYYKAKFEAEVQPETISSLLDLQMVKEKYPNSWNDADQCPWFGSLCYSFNQKNENGYETIKIVREIPNINDDFDAQSYYYHHNTNLMKVELDYLANYHELNDPLYEMYYSRRSTNVPFYDCRLYQEAINCWKKAIVVLPKENKNYLESKRQAKNDEEKELKRIENLKKKIFQKPFETMVFEGHTFKVIDIHEAHSIIGELTDFQGKKIYDVYGDDWRFPTYEDNPFFLLAEEEVTLEKFEMEYSTDENTDIFILGFIFKKSLTVEKYIIANDIDNSPALIVLGEVEASNISLFGNVFYFGGDLSCQTIMGTYNHGVLYAKGNTGASLIYSEDMAMYFNRFSNVDAVISSERPDIFINARLEKEEGVIINIEMPFANTHPLSDIIEDKFWEQDEYGDWKVIGDYLEKVFEPNLALVDEDKSEKYDYKNIKETIYQYFNNVIPLLEESGETTLDASSESYDNKFRKFETYYEFAYQIKRGFNIRMRIIVTANDFETNWVVLEYLDKDGVVQYAWQGKIGDAGLEMRCVYNGIRECYNIIMESHA